jgi:uncharacterized membrane protein YphA (DoxX/SURF4 family)
MARTVLRLARSILGVVFVVAGTSKLDAPYEFLSSVYAFGLFGPVAGYWIAWMLPWLELTVGCALLCGFLESGSLALIVALSSCFVFVKAMALHRERQIGCGCIVIAERGILGVKELLFSVGLFAASVVVFSLTLRPPAASVPDDESALHASTEFDQEFRP